MSKADARPKPGRRMAFDSDPYVVDLAEYNMFESPQRNPTSYRAVRDSRTDRHFRRKHGEYRRNRLQEEEGEQEEEPQLEVQAPDTASIMKSLNSIYMEVSYLRAANIVSKRGMAVIMGQLPQSVPVLYSQKSNVRRGRRRRRRRRRRRTSSDSRGSSSNSDSGDESKKKEKKKKKKKDTYQWAINVAKKFGDSAMFGAGATFAGELMKDAMKRL